MGKRSGTLYHAAMIGGTDAGGTWPIGASEMHAFVRTYDWAATPLGPIGSWPGNLKAAVDLLLASAFPSTLLWGDSLVLIYNDAARQVLPQGHLALGMPFYSCWPHLRHFHHRIFERVWRGETIRLDDQHYRNPQGNALTDKWLTMSYSPVRDEVGRIAGICLSAIDTSERVRAETALRQSEARYRAFVHATSGSLYRMDADGTTLLEMSGNIVSPYDPTATPLTLLDYVYPEDRNWVREAFAESLRSRCVFDVECRVLCRDGSYIWTHVRSVPVRNASGEIVEWIGSMRDITTRKEAELALRESERWLLEVLELAPVGIGLFDSEGNFVLRNGELRRFTGDVIPSRDVKGRWRVFDTAGHEVDCHDYPAARALRGEAVPLGVDMVTEIEGEQRWFKVGAVPLRREGTIKGGLVVAHDVTAIKATAGRLQVLVAELQHRTRNLIAMVQSLADNTLQGAASLDEFAMKFRWRLAALARVQSLLSRLTAEDTVSFDELLCTLLSAHVDLDQWGVTLEGPAGVRLPASTVQTLALALHELTTNAVKYGALSRPEASLAVRWHLAPADSSLPQLCVDWRESGVVMSEAGPRSRKGYGRELIERALPYQLGASTTFELNPDGVHCTICMPVGSDAPG